MSVCVCASVYNMFTGGHFLPLSWRALVCGEDTMSNIGCSGCSPHSASGSVRLSMSVCVCVHSSYSVHSMDAQYMHLHVCEYLSVCVCLCMLACEPSTWIQACVCMCDILQVCMCTCLSVCSLASCSYHTGQQLYYARCTCPEHKDVRGGSAHSLLAYAPLGPNSN